MGSTTKILSVMTQIDNAEGIASLLALIRDRDQLAERLSSGEAGFAFEYHEEVKTGRYVISDAVTVMCFSVTDITPQEARAIAAECRRMTEWGHPEFQAAAGRALGGTFERVQ
ncbi:MAG: hypothetical protein ACLPV8_26685 [Steroidobacteraceae bacterium]